MKLVIFVSEVILLTAPLIWACGPVRRWLGPELPLSRILLRVLLMVVAYLAYVMLSIQLLILIMRMVSA